jgi:hypothetical protein
VEDVGGEEARGHGCGCLGSVRGCVVVVVVRCASNEWMLLSPGA